jgi:hypothetical protein
MLRGNGTICQADRTGYWCDRQEEEQEQEGSSDLKDIEEGNCSR